MDTTAITKFVIAELGKHRQPDDIVIAVCKKTGMQWAEAQQFIHSVQREHPNEIIGRRNTLLVVIGITTIIGGLSLAIAITLATLSGWIIFFLSLPIPYLGNVIYFGLGIALTAGGTKGLLAMKQK